MHSGLSSLAHFSEYLLYLCKMFTCFLILDKGEGFSHSISTSYCFILLQLSSFVAKSEPWRSWLGLFQQGNHLTLVSSNPDLIHYSRNVIVPPRDQSVADPIQRSRGGRIRATDSGLSVGFMVLML